MANLPSPVERIKAASRRLRGSLVASLADRATGALREDDTHVLKFHGSYQQDDRDQREERRLRKLEPAYRFMIRTRLPGGICTPAQWLALDELARRYGNGSLRLTTRQTFQVHGIVKENLKPTIAAVNAVLIDTFGACGDVNRNVIASANPLDSRAHAAVSDSAGRLSAHLLPRTRAYHEIWLDEKLVGGGEEEEPLYGATYLPRKFKAAIAVPPINDVDVFAQDLGLIAIVDAGELRGFNLAVGGGLGATHGEPGTYPRLADVIGFLEPARLLEVAATVLAIQRDFGDRSDRKQARLKYTIDRIGLAAFKDELARRLGAPLAPPRPFEFTASGDRFGWTQDYRGEWQLTLRIPAGRIADRPEAAWLSGLREIARLHTGHFRLTPNQNLIIAGIAEAAREDLQALVSRHALDLHERATPVARDALACVALPTCPLAMAEAERYLPELTERLEARLQAHGLREVPLSLRISGCPNGCSRPYLAEIALIGKAPGRYNLHLGADATGQRLNVLYRENIDEAALFDTLDPLFAAYAQLRRDGERFGDFLWRTGRLAAAPATPA